MVVEKCSMESFTSVLEKNTIVNSMDLDNLIVFEIEREGEKVIAIQNSSDSDANLLISKKA